MSDLKFFPVILGDNTDGETCVVSGELGYRTQRRAAINGRGVCATATVENLRRAVVVELPEVERFWSHGGLMWRVTDPLVAARDIPDNAHTLDLRATEGLMALAALVARNGRGGAAEGLDVLLTAAAGHAGLKELAAEVRRAVEDGRITARGGSAEQAVSADG
ncbi:hypothetical protein AB0E01_22520 [Nocardia vinacea]|uniref:hypothetical protein n=1 Tax=Nocardia vinacea TaxID=96468 RepID=UPI0033C20468